MNDERLQMVDIVNRQELKDLSGPRKIFLAAKF